MNSDKFKRFDLSIDTLQELKNNIERKYGREVECINDYSLKGYRFVLRENNNVTVAIVPFNSETGRYNQIQFNPNIEEELRSSSGDFDFDKIKDLVVLNWANFAMKLFTDVAYREKNENILALRDKIYSSFYIPIKMDEFSYSDAVNDNPNGYKDEIIASYRKNFRDDAKDFNKVLDFDFKLENSPYARAIVVVNGKVVSGSDPVVKVGDKVITYVSNEYDIYIPMSAIDGMGEDDITDNVTYKGETYVNSSYINDDE